MSLGFNQKIIHDFLYDDITQTPKFYGSHRTKRSAVYFVGGSRIQVANLQIEIDFTVEKDGQVVVFEAKNGFPADFAVYQIFLPQLHYHLIKTEKGLPIESIHCCYLLRDKQDNGQSIVRLYQYKFLQADDMSTIKLVKSREYRLLGT